MKEEKGKLRKRNKVSVSIKKYKDAKKKVFEAKAKLDEANKVITFWKNFMDDYVDALADQWDIHGIPFKYLDKVCDFTRYQILDLMGYMINSLDPLSVKKNKKGGEGKCKKKKEIGSVDKIKKVVNNG